MEHDYKSTLNLPKTDFPLKGQLPQQEPKRITQWQQTNIYTKMVERNRASGPCFYLLDGPIYANGSLHIGHAFNRILKDILIKYKNMSGHYAPFIPGWDCHGLPIEQKVLEKIGEKKNLSAVELRQKCHQEALKWVELQQKQFLRLGLLAHWEKPYLTLSPSYMAQELRELAKVLQQKRLYCGVKPIYWNFKLKTALADAEVEYRPRKSPSIYVTFPLSLSHASDTLKETASKTLPPPLEKHLASLTSLVGSSPVSLLIWTTTPWTLPANEGVCLHGDMEYSLFEVLKGSFKGEYLIFASALQKKVEETCSLSLKVKKEGIFKGSDLEGWHVLHPLFSKKVPVILGEHVSADTGTGCVHTAPGHGMDDYQVGLKYQLPVTCPVNEGGVFTEEAGPYAGIFIFKANPLIIEDLQKKKRLLASTELEHSYPHCWRSDVPLIFRATSQWFISVDTSTPTSVDDSKKPSANPSVVFSLRQRALNLIEEEGISFHPQWGQVRFKSMMEKRPDWCISRQRIWGLPLPIFYCRHTQVPILSNELIERIAQKVEEKGLEGYYASPAETFMDSMNPEKMFHGSLNPKMNPKRPESSPSSIPPPPKGFGSKGFEKSTDILDVWYDSAVAYAVLPKEHPELKYPADIYMEGSDQHRGWFNSSLTAALATGKDQSPYKKMVTHGFVNDSQGHKMSKSKGNVTDPQKIAQEMGAEILRLWVIYEDYRRDLTCGQMELQRVKESYRRIRNSTRFLLGVLYDFEIEKHEVPYPKLLPLDQWILACLYELETKVHDAYQSYQFYRIYQELNPFFTVKLSSLYFDILKDRLYTAPSNSTQRRSAQTAIFYLSQHLFSLLAPVLSFLAEEAFTHFKAKAPTKEWAQAESIFLTPFPKLSPQWQDKDLLHSFDTLLELRSRVTKELELAREKKQISSSLEAKVKVWAEGEDHHLLTHFLPHLCELWIVSQVHLTKGSWRLQIEIADGQKCLRCWKYSVEKGKNKEHPELCPACVKTVVTS